MDPDLSGAGSTLLGGRCKAPAVRFANMLFVSDDKTNSQRHWPLHCRPNLVESTSSDLQLHGAAFGPRMEHSIGRCKVKDRAPGSNWALQVRTVHAEAESETVSISKGGILRSFGLVNPLEYEEVRRV